ncbi:MAG TPA: redox-sensing transcriptional repressor Rex [Bacillota bacterium]|nr:redox-sensing transcriptional repressor Rex [Bacillota bacterium]HOK69441.1 redox-sensing transcriptional repressor Rex [Bacillota bacterium]HPP84944.1 redox-sensing transcriptional repressor Rex [Bacillota bacterium]
MFHLNISKSTLQRLPLYLNYLKSVRDKYVNISATIIADALKLNDVQVRKDLASVSSSGKPKVGYVTEDLIKELEDFLGYNTVNNAIIVGAGKLGKALMGYSGFKEYGLNILMAFDSDPKVIDEAERIMPIEKLPEFCRKMNIKIGIITVPAQNAQEVCDLLVESGVLAIWNFAPVHLRVPEDILVQNENMAAALAVLSNHLAEKLK